MPTDPVCGMYVPETSDLFLDKDGQRYYFCSKTCLDKFKEPEAEGKKLKLKLLVGWGFSIPIVVLEYISFVFKDYVLLALALPVMFYSGMGFYNGAYQSLKNKSGNMDLLISIGTLTAFFFSVFVTFFPKAIPHSNVYYDASTFIISLILTGSYIESITKRKANDAAEKLMSIIPETAHIIRDGKIIDVKVSDIKPGERSVIKPGEIIPFDGTVISGSADVDESMITGEQIPALKTAESKVTSGTKDLNGELVIEVLKTGHDTTVMQIHDLIVMASSGRTKVQKIADTFSSYFIPVVLSSATASFLFWYFYLKSVGFPDFLEIAILAFVSVVVIACPCAIGLAGPITLLISSEESSKLGIVIKNTGALDRISRTNRIVFDKSGTLTENLPRVSDVRCTDEVLAMVASVEKLSAHPVAKAIVNYAESRGIEISNADNVREIAGYGISGTVSSHKIQIEKIAGKMMSVGIKIDGRDEGSISFEYELRENAGDVISRLKDLGIKVSVVSGDPSKDAENIISGLGIDDIRTGIDPIGKSNIIKEYQKNGDYVTFIGDGINDSIALETADAGIAMSSGSDISKSAGDVILMNDNLMNVYNLRIISEKTMKKVKQNIFWAIIYNSILIPVAAGVLVPIFTVSIYSILPMLAAFAMGMSSTTVVLNSLRLKKNINSGVALINRQALSPIS
ncbi:MAG: heavy metal translocating P-type ATPase [Thermoplasmata archaeon]